MPDPPSIRTAAHPPALIIGGGSANGLGIARNLGARGIPVYCLTSNPHELTVLSRYCTGYRRVPRVEDDPHVMRTTLDQLSQHLSQPCVLFPTTDTAVLTLADIQHRVSPHHLVLPDRNIVERMVIKTKFYQSLQMTSIPHPVTFDPDHCSFQDLIQNLTFPVFIRPAQTLLYLQHFRGKGFLVQTHQELRRYLQLAQTKNIAVLVQEIIPGPTENGYIVKGYITRRGTLKILITKQKMWQPSLFSNSSISVTIPPQHVADFSTPLIKYLDHQRYRGLFGAEFKRDARDGEVKLLEVNARSTGDSYMGRACGTDDIFAAYQDALGHPITAPKIYRTGVHYINELSSLQTFVNYARQGQLVKGISRVLASKKCLHTFSGDDPLPAINDVWQTIKRLTEALKKST